MNKETETISEIERILLKARKPVLVEEIAKAIQCTTDKTQEYLVRLGERRGLRFTDCGASVGLTDGFGGV